MKYLKIVFVFVLVNLLCQSGVFAQETKSVPLLVLDNYTVPIGIKGAKVGTFQSNDNLPVTLVNDPSGLFEITKDNNLVLKKNKELPSDASFVYTLKVKSRDAEKSFDIVKDEFIKNKVIAHRGAWKHHDVSQNTLGSIKAAMDLGCEAAEIDVWLTKDKQIIVCHDMDLDGRIIEKTALKDLKEIKLKNGESAPTLEECLTLMKTQNKMRLVVELKSNSWNANVVALADSVVDLVNTMNAQAWVDYISFDYRGLKKVKEKDATAHLSLLEPSVDLDLQKLDGMSGVDYYYTVFDKMPRLYERCSVLGLTTNAWTVNDKDQMTKLLSDGIRFITTDEPELLLEVIGTTK